jgi:hypothetical protein
MLLSLIHSNEKGYLNKLYWESSKKKNKEKIINGTRLPMQGASQNIYIKISYLQGI